MNEYAPLLAITLLLILGAELVNGWTDAPNAIATIVATRVLSLKKAIAIATVMNVLGVMSGTAVAATIGKGIVESRGINLTTISAAMCALIIWSTIAWKFGLPTSESHALVAALSGAGLATAGPEVLLWDGWQKVIVGLFFSTFLGLTGAYLLTRAIRVLFASFPPSTTQKFFGVLQILSASLMGFSHGSNDGQKFIGVFALALVLGGVTKEFLIPLEVILLCAIAMGIGTSLGGWRIIRTMGIRMARIETYQGFAAESAAAGTILFASRLGIPISTTHTIGTSIMGAGAGHRISLLKLNVIKQVALAWILTFPISASLAFFIVFITRVFVR